MSERADGVHPETKVERRRRLLGELFADFEARGVGVSVAENLSREELYGRGRARAEIAETEAKRRGDVRRVAGGAGDR